MKGRKLAAVLAMTMGLTALAGCGNTASQNTAENPASSAGSATVSDASENSSSGSAVAADGNTKGLDRRLKFVYVCKQLSHPWFIQEEMGIQKACNELGIDYVGIDSDNNDEKCLQDIDNAFSMQADALLLCITNQSMGPNVANMCENEGIPLVTIDDNIQKEDGTQVAHVGMPTKEVGTLGGEALGKAATEKGFFENDANVKVMQINIPTNTVFGPRLDGYKEGLMSTTPLTEDDFIRVDASDATAEYEGNMQVAAPVITAHPEVDYWIITGANDDCALAPMDVLKEQGFDMTHVLGCGLGGYEMSLERFKNGDDNYMAIVLQPDVEGYKAVYEAYENIVNQTPMEENTFVSGEIANSENYLDYYPNGKLMTDQD